MKQLAGTTVRKAFIKLGFITTDNGLFLATPQTRSTHLSVSFHPGIRIAEGRWRKRSNVHIVSYWIWPRSLAELNSICEGIKDTYQELCGTQFDEEEV